ncbi:MAG: hypothetical protein U0271_08350 [Polyangiaceae bacterium]
MTCELVRDALKVGAPLDEGLAAHARTCASCSVLLQDDAQLGRALSTEPSRPASAPPSFAALVSELERERGLRATLGAWPTRRRVGALATVTGLFVFAWVVPRIAAGRFGPHGALSLVELAAELAVLAALGAIGLRPMHARPLPEWVRVAVLVGAVAAPAVGVLTSAEFAPAHAALSPAPCLVMGAGLTVPAFLLVWALARGELGPRLVVALLFGTTLAEAILAVRCHVPGGAHVLAGHVPLGITAVVVGAFVALGRHRSHGRG